MTLQTARVEVTSAATLVFGSTSTIINNSAASWYDPIQATAETGTVRVFINPTSTGTTANSFVVAALSIRQFALARASQWWFFTSAGTTAFLSVLGGSR